LSTPASRSAPAADGTFTHRQILTIISGLLLGMFLAALDQTVVSTAIRTIADDLQGYDLQAWATTSFLITSTIATPLYGKLSDLFGRRPFYLLAIGVFVVGSALCSVAWSMYSLAAFRAVQGIGAGGLLSLAFTILGDLVPPRERSKYQAYFMAVFASSSVLGPVVGGLLSGADSIAGLTGWRWIFLVNVPLGVVAFVVVARVLRIPHVRRPHRIDWPGALALTVFLVPLLIVAEQGREWGWSSAGALTCYAIGAVGLAAFITAEARYGDEALLPLALFGNRTYGVGVVASLIVGMGMFGGLLLLPQYLQVVRGSSPTVAGFQMLPLVLGIMIASAISGVLTSRTGRYKIFPIIGTALMTIALLLFSRIGADTPLPLLMVVMLVFGMGLGGNMQSVILAVQNAVDPRSMGVATSAVTFFRQIGGTLGTAVFLSVLFSTLGGRIGSAFSDASRDPAFQAALAANPDQAAQLQQATGGGLASTEQFTSLDPVLAQPFRVGFTDSLDAIFLIGAAVLAVGFVVTLFLPELPLRTMSGVQAQAAGTGAVGEGPAGSTSDASPVAQAAAPAASTFAPPGSIDQTVPEPDRR